MSMQTQDQAVNNTTITHKPHIILTLLIVLNTDIINTMFNIILTLFQTPYCLSLVLLNPVVNSFPVEPQKITREALEPVCPAPS